jgi:hypothetical protein
MAVTRTITAIVTITLLTILLLSSLLLLLLLLDEIKYSICNSMGIPNLKDLNICLLASWVKRY